jgi:zinc D-Ala-D-Ala carboxypeptidase
MIYGHYTKYPMHLWRWPSFSPREIASKGEGELMVNEAAMDKLQALRNRLGVPLLITSAYRSRVHNRRVGGAKASKHLEGIAFDVRMENHDPHEFEAAARAVGFTGFGYYPKSGFMHVDTGPARSWGTPWPKTRTRLPVEPPIQPETIRDDTEAQAAVGAAGAGGLAVALDTLPVASTLLGNLAPVAQTIAIVAALVLIGFVIWKRVK